MTLVEDPSSPTPRFSESLRSATWADHQRAERSTYIQALLGGELDRDGYAAMVDQHWHIYRVLESAADAMRAEPQAAAFVDERLTRLPLLEADLLALWGPDWRARSRALPATEAYCERLREVCFDWPGGFVAHHYTRYLGDLSGGQFIGRFVQRHFDLADGGGADFYRFDGIDDPAAYREDYRGKLDAAAWSPDEQARIIGEIGRAYEHNTAVFEGLSQSCVAPG
jgi:heme oxygenase